MAGTLDIGHIPCFTKLHRLEKLFKFLYYVRQLGKEHAFIVLLSRAALGWI